MQDFSLKNAFDVYISSYLFKTLGESIEAQSHDNVTMVC